MTWNRINCLTAPFGIGLVVYDICGRLGMSSVEATAAGFLVVMSCAYMLIIILTAIEGAGRTKSN
jgi:hypothetical protein